MPGNADGTMELDELRAEWASSARVGESIFKQVRSICAQTSKNYLAKTYSSNPSADTTHGTVWDDDDLEDLVARAFEWLLENDQFTYAFDNANDLSHWNNLIGRQIRHMLTHRTNKTPIDNLAERSKSLLGESPFQALDTALHTWYRLGAQPEPTATDRHGNGSNLERLPQFRDARERVSLIPRQQFDLTRERQRSPRVYNDTELSRCLEAIAAAYPYGFTLPLVEAIFKDLLTFLDVPSLTSIDLQPTGDSQDDTVNLIDQQLGQDHGSEVEREALDASLTIYATEMLDRFDNTEREILRRWASKESQTKIGRDLNLGVRQTAARRIEEVIAQLAELGQELIDAGLSSDEFEHVSDTLMMLLAAEADPGTTPTNA